ncbi:hypothetical protein SLS58_007164 [Diplodia intermedia]|uniref:Uncharacterized protein n=1 Tax=Diplodia intermedia TaxID=856260 RepID=A0ABR3TL12_9PEZI
MGSKHELAIDVDHHNENDVSQFICKNLNPDPSVDTNEEELRLIQEEIIKKAGKSFQWASFVVKKVNGMFTELETLPRIRKHISKTPTDLQELYMQLISPPKNTRNRDDQEVRREQALTLKLFQWLCFSKTPLTIFHIQHALVLGPGEPPVATSSDHSDFKQYQNMAVTVTKISRGLAEWVTATLRYRDPVSKQWA